MMRTLKLIFFAFFLTLNISSVGAATQIENSIALVDNLIVEIKKTVTLDASSQVKIEHMSAIIDNFFDYNFIARFTAGQAWRKASPEQREAYKVVFREALLKLAEMQFSNLATIDYKTTDTEVKSDKLTIISGTITTDGSQENNVEIAWRVRTKPNKPPRIIDIEVENISMLLVQQQENNAIIRRNKGDFQALIDAIEAQNNR